MSKSAKISIFIILTIIFHCNFLIAEDSFTLGLGIAPKIASNFDGISMGTYDGLEIFSGIRTDFNSKNITLGGEAGFTFNGLSTISAGTDNIKTIFAGIDISAYMYRDKGCYLLLGAGVSADYVSFRKDLQYNTIFLIPSISLKYYTHLPSKDEHRLPVGVELIYRFGEAEVPSSNLYFSPAAPITKIGFSSLIVRAGLIWLF